jgi:class 3 adenylate cyclase
MPEIPTGTVTFLFTDIEGSTRLLADAGRDYATLLSVDEAVDYAVGVAGEMAGAALGPRGQAS